MGYRILRKYYIIHTFSQNTKCNFKSVQTYFGMMPMNKNISIVLTNREAKGLILHDFDLANKIGWIF